MRCGAVSGPMVRVGSGTARAPGAAGRRGRLVGRRPRRHSWHRSATRAL